MLCPIILHAKRTPLAPAVITDQRTFSYLELAEAIEEKSSKLLREGIKQGDHIALIAHRSLETIILFWALQRIGVVTCLLREDLPEKALQKQLIKAQAKLLKEQSIAFSSCFDRHLNMTQPATLLFTSGSSSESKIALHSLNNHFSSAKGLLMHLPLTARDIWQLKLPLYHVAGLSIVFRCFLTGAAISLTEKAPYTHISLIPTQLMQTDGIEKAKVILLGGGPINGEMPQKLPIYFSYGLTEMSSTVTLNGALLPYRSLKIKEGEIYLKGETLFLGYYGQSPPVDEEGFFATGDLGAFSEEEV